MIYTFYSYKGGVGRSMALANLAKWFYMHGLRVVIVDWDLEAPGLENFFFDAEESDGEEQIRFAQDRPGVIDLLIRYQRRFSALPIPSWPRILTSELESVLPTSLPTPLHEVSVKQVLKTLDQRLPTGLRPAFDTLETKSALAVLKKYLPESLEGSSLEPDQILTRLTSSLPPVLIIPIERTDTSALLKSMEEAWVSMPAAFETESETNDRSNEHDVSALLAVLGKNLTAIPGISFEEAYLEPLLSLVESSLPEVLLLATEVEEKEAASKTSIETKTLISVLRETLPSDFISKLRRAYAEALLEMLDDNLPAFSTMLFPILEGRSSENGTDPDPRRASDDERPPGLWLLSAGWRLDERFTSYAQNVQGFDWSGFYNSYQGEAYFEWMRKQLNAFADIVLIDSRTGVTEMGGVCTRQLADVVVSFVAPNGQNLKGVATFLPTTGGRARPPEVGKLVNDNRRLFGGSRHSVAR